MTMRHLFAATSPLALIPAKMTVCYSTVTSAAHPIWLRANATAFAAAAMTKAPIRRNTQGHTALRSPPLRCMITAQTLIAFCLLATQGHIS